MGGHYGSIHIHTTDRDRVRDAAERVAKELAIRFLLGPARNGWVGLYPEHHGQDDNVGRVVAEAIGDCDVLMVQVHDDDVFAYQLYRDGVEADSFNASPDYFGDNPAERAKIGNPEAFRPLLGDRIDRLVPLLTREHGAYGAFESERLAVFARLLKIANAVQAYEYLLEDDHGGVRGWRQFEPVPAAAAKTAAEARRQERTAFRRTIKSLLGDGRLRYWRAEKDFSALVCGVDDGFVIAGTDFRTGGEALLWRPSSDRPRALPLEAATHLSELACAGRRVLVGGGQRVRVFDVTGETWADGGAIADPDLVVGVAIASDGRHAAHLSRNEAVVTDLGTGRTLLRTATRDHHAIAVHPAEPWVVFGGTTLRLATWDDAGTVHERFVGGRSRAPEVVQSIFRSKLVGMDLNAIEREQRSAIDKQVEHVVKMLAKSKVPGEQMTPERVAELRQQMETAGREQIARLTALQRGELPPSPPQSVERVRNVGFTRDGRWLWCGTTGGLNVYAWPRVRDEPTLPPPAFRVGASDGATVAAVAEEPGGDSLVFTGANGTLQRLFLNDGTSRPLFTPLDGRSPVRVAFTADAAFMAVTTHAVVNGRTQSALAVWDYRRLMK